MYKYANYDVLIFDLGNTILPIAPELTTTAFCELGFDGNILQPSKEIQLMLDNYQKGRVSSPEFLKFLHSQLSKELTVEVIKKAWNAMLLDFPNMHLQLLARLKKTHRLILLSNTNSLHAECFEAKAKQQGKALHTFFDVAYYSHELGLSKPDSAIYKYVQKDSDLEGKSILFLDDLSENLVVPQKMGWDVVQISQGRGILDFQ